MGIERELRVKAGAEEYPIFLGTGLLAGSGRLLRAAGLKEKVLVVTNPKVGGLYLEPLLKGLEQEAFRPQVVMIPDGEEYKQFAQLERVYDAAVEARLERDSAIIALGGGVIGDLAGLAAATYLRGVQFVQVPTTLLAQVDSSIGGKVAVNHREGKNLIGAFYQPRVVISDLNVLSTLDEREYKSGLAEIIKAGLIGDPELYHLLVAESDAVKARAAGVLLWIIELALRFKARVVEADLFEHGLREILNYGHTIGHALEAETNYSAYRHGEAVAIGMRGAALLSEELGLCPPEVSRKTTELLAIYNLPHSLPAIPAGRLLARMKMDKKIKGGKLRFVLTKGIGEAILKADLQPELLTKVLWQLGAGKGEEEG